LIAYGDPNRSAAIFWSTDRFTLVSRRSLNSSRKKEFVEAASRAHLIGDAEKLLLNDRSEKCGRLLGTQSLGVSQSGSSSQSGKRSLRRPLAISDNAEAVAITVDFRMAISNFKRMVPINFALRASKT